jgi:ribonuclease E
MAFIKSLLIASVATLAVAAPGYEYGSAQAKAVEQPAYGAAPAVQAPAYTAPKPAVKEPEVYEAPKPAVKEPEVYAAPKPAVKEPEKYAAPTKKAMKQPEYKVDPVAAKAPAYAEPAIVQTVVIEEAVAPAPAPAVVEPAVVEPAVVAAPVVEEEPTTEIDVSSQESAPVCGNDQQLACCNSGEDLIGANCLSIGISKFPEIRNLITLQNLILTRIL